MDINQDVLDIENIYYDNHLSVIFKDLIEEIFITHGFTCRKLYYGNEVYYCARDILKALNYSSHRTSIFNTLLKLKHINKFTIQELQDIYNIEIDHNIDVLLSNQRNHDRFIYVNKEGFETILQTTRKIIPKNIIKLCDIMNIKYQK